MKVNSELPDSAAWQIKPPFWDQATQTLAARDHILRRLIANFPDIHLVRRGDAFTTLARAIVGQQISVKAAQTIWERLVKANGGGGEPVHLDPAGVRRGHGRAPSRAGLDAAQAEGGRDPARPSSPGVV